MNMPGFEMVTIIAEATDGVDVWWYGVTGTADMYDRYPQVRVQTQATATEALAANSPAGLPVTITEHRWTQTLDQVDPWD